MVAPNLLCKPATVMFNKVTIKGAKQAVQMFGPAQRAVAMAVADSVEAGTIPADEADDIFISVGVFIPWVAKGYAATQSLLVPTFFPWWTQLLVVAGPLLAWWRIRPGRTDAQRRASLGSLTLLSMHLIAFGSVALRHSGPYCGQQGCVAQELLTLAAALVSLAGVLSLALCLGEALLATVAEAVVDAEAEASHRSCSC